MSKVFLVQPPWYILQGIRSETASLGLGYLSAVLENAGHQVMIFNGEPPCQGQSVPEEIAVDINSYRNAHELTNPVWDRFKNSIRLFRPDIVGISMWTGAYRSALNIARLSKEFNPDIPVIAGGIHATLLPEHVLKESMDIDYVVVGEGEQTLPELISSLENGFEPEKVSGIYFRKGRGIIRMEDRPFIEVLDILPFPYFENTFEYEYYGKCAFGGIITSRGCPYLCSYCASNKLWARNVRFRSSENVVDEIEQRTKALGINNIRFNDDTFIIRKDRVFDICELIIDRRLDIRWQCDIRADLSDRGVLKKMKQAGCYQVNIGAESGNVEILDKIDKKITLGQVRQAVKAAKGSGIKVAVYFMAGFPDETKEQVLDTIQLMYALRPDVPIWSLVTPYPGTKIYEYASDKKLLPKDDNWALYFHHSPKMRLTDAITESEWKELIGEIKTYCNRSRQINAKKQRIYLFFQRAGVKNILGFLRRKYLLFRSLVSQNFVAPIVIILNKEKGRAAFPKVYYGYPQNVSTETAAFLKIKKLQQWFPDCKKDFNLIYTVNGYPPDYAICCAAKKAGVPIVYNANGVCYKAWYGPYWNRQNEFLRRVYNIADYIIFQSNFSKLSAETFLGPPNCKWEVLYNAVDTGQLVPVDNKPADELVILCGGNHIILYPLAVLAEAFKIVKKEYSAARLIISGRLWSGRGHFQVDGRIQQLVHRAGLGQAVEFQPEYSQRQAVDIFRQAVVFVTCRYAEPCPSTVIEAMACGLPIVYSASGGTPELVGPDAGIGIPVKLDWDYYQVPEPVDIADAIIKVVKNRETMSQAARNRAVKYFDIKHWLERHNEIFCSLLR